MPPLAAGTRTFVFCVLTPVPQVTEHGDASSKGATAQSTGHACGLHAATRKDTPSHCPPQRAPMHARLSERKPPPHDAEQLLAIQSDHCPGMGTARVLCVCECVCVRVCVSV